jgi:hypothetical protein
MLRYKIFPAAVNTNGVKVNGTWIGIIGSILREVNKIKQ